jgi:hypothetical protein
VHHNGAKAQSFIIQKLCAKGGHSLLSLPSTMEKNFSLYFKHYNLTIRVVNFFETFCTCSSSSLGQDRMVESEKKYIKKTSFELLELEMVDLECFLRKMALVL